MIEVTSVTAEAEGGRISMRIQSRLTMDNGRFAMTSERNYSVSPILADVLIAELARCVEELSNG